ncbi:beta-ketoacyl-[acyl-carrier-protein] synthase family protein [Kineosporia mesophila]|uniref:Beta-ketoacyl-[acyl-carrier-protein] synthase family protein n=1 Tax=Kineosporia mesophila TaxID=566012 RepID=A0ABP7A570_9ACTN|nr:beta-ketoacyl-[acyl-carrier-protein] synthase family protein [Kineosporia mesophila]MCD5351483.1 beta-ketoacyl-[acyl-carrier-protein] synthase family protein [Kineosporia mesophila]
MTGSVDRQIAVTGMGATTPLGGDVKTTWEAALAGSSGARALEAAWLERYPTLPVEFACRLAQPVTEKLTLQEIKRLDPSGQYALISAREAWADAGAPEVEPERLAVCMASGIGGLYTTLQAYDTLNEKGARRVLPLTVPMLMPNGPAAAIGLELGARAGVHTPVSACASGAEAIAQGADLIRRGLADVVVAGGTEGCIHPVTIAAFGAMQALSKRNDDITRASRPYDVDRNGFVMGEGSGTVVLESMAHAKARGATIHGILAGVGVTSDGYHISAPEPEGKGAARAIRAALADGDLAPSDVQHLNAHATSTPVGDVAEAKAIRLALGDATDGVAISATKSMTGHLLGAAGALEAIFTLLAVRDGIAPPTTNLDNQDPNITLDVVTREPRKLPSGDRVAVNNAFGFGGHNVALAFRSAS